jgi:hypothetical protein
MADLQTTAVTGTLSATQGLTGMATLAATTSVSSPEYIGDSNACVFKNKSGAGTQGTITLDSSGNILLNSDAGNIQLQRDIVASAGLTVDTDTLVVDATNDRVGVNVSPAEAFHVTGNNVTTGDVVSNYSDERLKTNINPIENALDKLNSLRGFDYDNVDANSEIGFQPTRKSDVGLSAQELQKVLPHAVCIAPFDMDGNGGSKSGQNYLTIRYERVVPLLVEAIKELNAKLESHNH